MKGAEIQAGKRYAANVNYTKNVVVDVLETGVSRSRGYSGKARSDGVRVRVAMPYYQWGRPRPAGDEHTITTRDVIYEWTDEHEQARKAREAEEAELARRSAALDDALLELHIDARVSRDRVSMNFDAAEALIALASREKEADA